jgi:adenosylcobinamide kinase/adenosylcobinamide-phosphate guanylyltransferase
MVEVARTELILGGQKSGKSRRSEALAAAWMASGASRRAVLVATALPGDEEMRARIERHRRERVPGLAVLEVPRDLPAALERLNDADTLVVVDCLTLWLTNRLMPLQGPADPPGDVAAAVTALGEALQASAGPVVLVSNEIGLGVTPLGAEVRGFVDALGNLNQAVAAVCERVTFMAAGLPWTLKGASR